MCEKDLDSVVCYQRDRDMLLTLARYMGYTELEVYTFPKPFLTGKAPKQPKWQRGKVVVPEYLYDLNAIHQVEIQLAEQKMLDFCYLRELHIVVEGHSWWYVTMTAREAARVAHATAEQRGLAAYRTIINHKLLDAVDREEIQGE